MAGNGRGDEAREVLIWMLFLAAPLIWLLLVVLPSFDATWPTVPISQVAKAVQAGTVRGLTAQGDYVTVEFVDGALAVTRKEPSQSIMDVLLAEGVTSRQLSSVTIQVVPAPLWSRIGLPVWASLAMFAAGILLLLWRRSPASGGADQTMMFLKSRARIIVADRPRVKFEDAAGVEEAKAELKEVVDFLRAPGRFTAVGARMPRGVLLVGPPGTGKTLLARAVAGEAGVPFFSVSASEFVELFVGVGASRVRDLFDQAKRRAPSIVFIDEIDAVGRQRGVGLGSGHDEREQTLNQILVEMDGFDQDTSVVVMAATNRADVLDPALLRPGRFDRRLVVDGPDLAGRRAILRVHARNKPLADGVELDRIAAETPGFSGADLENLMNEAAILAAREARTFITERDLEVAVDRVIAGPERKSRIISEKEKLITAYHEAGHAVVAYSLPSVEPVQKVTIVPRGVAGGYTRLLTTSDRQIWARSELLEMLAFTLGGMAAEALVLGETTTGPANDLERATALARQMVCDLGMSDRLGPVALGQGEPGIDRRDVGNETDGDVDREIRELINGSLLRARRLLEERRATLDRVASCLIQEETLQGERLLRLLAGEATDDPRDERPDQAARARVSAESPASGVAKALGTTVTCFQSAGGYCFRDRGFLEARGMAIGLTLLFFGCRPPDHDDRRQGYGRSLDEPSRRSEPASRRRVGIDVGVAGSATRRPRAIRVGDRSMHQPDARRPLGVTLVCALLVVKGLASLAMAADLIFFERVGATHLYQYLAVPGLLTGALLLYKAYGLWHLHFRALVMVLVAVALDGLVAVSEILAGMRVVSVWVNLALAVAIAAYLLRRGVRERFHAGRITSHTQ